MTNSYESESDTSTQSSAQPSTPPPDSSADATSQHSNDSDDDDSDDDDSDDDDSDDDDDDDSSGDVVLDIPMKTGGTVHIAEALRQQREASMKRQSQANVVADSGNNRF